ncbi:MAG: UvrD-helicase domain-containing protein [Bacteroidota bacterium]|nr:UvrD-helicase domain-containing protein [Bacteroidota bacterium]
MSETIFTESQKQALNLKQHISVTANAGSGKTTVLVNRFLEALLNTDCRIEEIVAITFTEKAASELKRKIAESVIIRSKSETNSELLKKVEYVHDHLSSANISTIHAFCAQLLRQFPVEANIDFAFTILEGVDRNILQNDSVVESITKTLEDSSTGIYSELIFTLRNLGKKEIQNILSTLLEKREYVEKMIEPSGIFSTGNTDDNILKYWQRNAEEIIDSVVNNTDWLNSVSKILHSSKSKSAESIKANITQWDENLTKTEKCSLYYNIVKNLLTKEGNLNRNVIGRNTDTSEFFDDTRNIRDGWFEVKEIIETVTDKNFGTYQRTLLRFSRTLVELYKMAIEIYDNKKSEMSYLDYDDLQLLTRRLLENDDIRKRLADKYKYIMIDEYQDTNFLQYEIFLPLLSRLKTGNLFIVGDPKQSIFGFRNAEVEVFERTKYDIANAFEIKTDKQSNIVLAESFRLLTDIVCFVNLVFSSIMKKSKQEYEVEYDELIKGRKNPAHGKIELILSIPGETENEGDKKKQSELIAGECEMIARRILNLHQTKHQIFDRTEISRDFQFKDAAILIRSRTHLKQLEKCFNKFKIPYIISGGIGFYQTQEIYDFFNYFQFLLNNHDDVALVGLLRSPFFVVSDSELYEIANISLETNFWNKFITYVKTELASEYAKRAAIILNDNINYATRLPIPTLVHRIFRQTGWLGTISGIDRGDQSKSNVEKLLRIAREFEGKGFTNLFDFVERLKLLISGEMREGQANIEDGEDAVQILTIHSAKGLEFPVVFVPFLNKSFKYDAPPFIDDKLGLGFKISEETGTDKIEPLNYALLKNLSRSKTEAEEKRILYVACTRAKDMLVLSGSVNNSVTGYLDWVLTGLGIEFDTIKTGNLIIPDALVKTLELVDNKYVTKTIKHNLTIQVYKSLEDIPIESSVAKSLPERKLIGELLVEPLHAHIHRDFFSATQVQTYMNCPTKYFLKYHLGIPEPDIKRVNFYEEEDANDLIRGEITGSIIHNILERFQEFDEVQIKSFIDDYLLNEMSGDVFDSNQVTENISSTIKSFYESGYVKKIFSYPEYKTEFTVNSVFGEDFLTGTIDRLYKNEKGKCCIIDYKTGTFAKNLIEQKAQEFRSQMIFYALLVSRLFNQDEVIATILFTSYPDSPQNFLFNRQDFQEFEALLKSMISEIKCGTFERNEKMCNFCGYQSDGKCIYNPNNF